MKPAPGPWRFERVLSKKLQGSVWVVKNPSGRTGYFKFANAEQWKYSGPFIANEWIAAKLAKRLGFPVAEPAVTEVTGPDGTAEWGMVSAVVDAREVTTWDRVDDTVRERPGKYLTNMSRLQQLVVFDAWIANVDRAVGKNIVLYRQASHERYRWYLIDHALTLLGAPYKWQKYAWQTFHWNQLWRYYHVPKGLLQVQSSWDALLPMVEQIEQLPRSEIEEFVHRVPLGTLADDLQGETVALLLHRQARLRRIIERWLTYQGVKEFGQQP